MRFDGNLRYVGEATENSHYHEFREEGDPEEVTSHLVPDQDIAVKWLHYWKEVGLYVNSAGRKIIGPPREVE